MNEILEISNIRTLYNYLDLELSNNYVCALNFDYIELPENITRILEKRFPDQKNFNYYPRKFITKSSLYSTRDHIYSHRLEIDKFIKNLMNLNMSSQLVMLFGHVISEVTSFNLSNTSIYNNIKTLHLPNHLPSHLPNIKSYIIASTNRDQIALLDELTGFTIFTNQYILTILPNPDSYLLLSNNNIYLSLGETKLNMFFKEESDFSYKIYGYMKNSLKKEIFNFKINKQFDIVKNYEYTNFETKISIKYYSFDRADGMVYYKYNKNGCDFEEFFNTQTGSKQIISQCMMTNDDSGLRHRGKYTESTQNNKQVSKTIKFDDKIVYEKNGDEVIVDLLERKVLKQGEFIIGYKVAKSESGELRIVKLGIPPDAQIVRPIDCEYLITFGKERTNKAIVMDIQLPDKHNEISVVPEETSAYSYVFKVIPNNSENNNIVNSITQINSNTKGFEYKIGHEVFPDSFNPDENIGCAQGIHFHLDRMTVFKAFIDE